MIACVFSLIMRGILKTEETGDLLFSISAVPLIFSSIGWSVLDGAGSDLSMFSLTCEMKDVFTGSFTNILRINFLSLIMSEERVE